MFFSKLICHMILILIVLINILQKNKNYPALIYYSVNNHMYIVRDKFKAKGLVEKAKYIEIKKEYIYE